MPESYPFTVGYEAYFEKAKLVFHESDLNGKTEPVLTEYTASGQQEVILEGVNPYAKSIEHAIHSFQDNTESFSTLEQSLQSLHLAIEMKQRLVQGRFSA